MVEHIRHNASDNPLIEKDFISHLNSYQAEFQIIVLRGLGQIKVGNFNRITKLITLGLAENQADGGLVVFVSEQVVQRRAVKVHLAGVLRLEVALFQFDNDEAAQLEVEEKQIKIKIPVAHLQVILTPDKGKPGPQFQQEFFQVPD